MRRRILAEVAALTCPVLFAGNGLAQRMAIRPTPVPERVAMADVIVVGKVTALEKKTVSLTPARNSTLHIEHHVADVQIIDRLLGAKGLTELRVVFVQPARGRIGGRGPIRRPYALPTPEPGQEYLFFLRKHYEGDVYFLTGGARALVNKKSRDFDTEVAQARHCLRLLKKPLEGLKSTNAEDRLLTADLLILRYRYANPTWKPPVTTEPVSAEESRLILTALADADWSKNDPKYGISPVLLFNRLNLTAADGWVPPANLRNWNTAARDWLKKHAATYRLKRFVPGQGDEK